LALAGGTQLRLRPVESGDRCGVAALFVGLSPESRYRRCFSAKPNLTSRELSYLTDVDHVHYVAIAAINERDGSIVGVSQYVQAADRAGVAEVAVMVVDEFQGMGIGTALAAHTVRRARANGVAHLTATTLWENRAARALLRNLRFRVQGSSGPKIEHQLDLDCRGRPASSHEATRP
jgi:RimJ/RimL family protein N-acetyltransferase